MLYNIHMETLARFEVPTVVLGNFIEEVADRKMTATLSGKNYRGDNIVFVPYNDEAKEDIMELDEYLHELISDEYIAYCEKLDQE